MENHNAPQPGLGAGALNELLMKLPSDTEIASAAGPHCQIVRSYRRRDDASDTGDLHLAITPIGATHINFAGQGLLLRSEDHNFASWQRVQQKPLLRATFRNVPPGPSELWACRPGQALVAVVAGLLRLPAPEALAHALAEKWDDIANTLGNICPPALTLQIPGTQPAYGVDFGAAFEEADRTRVLSEKKFTDPPMDLTVVDMTDTREPARADLTPVEVRVATRDESLIDAAIRVSLTTQELQASQCCFIAAEFWDADTHGGVVDMQIPTHHEDLTINVETLPLNEDCLARLLRPEEAGDA